MINFNFIITWFLIFVNSDEKTTSLLFKFNKKIENYCSFSVFVL